MNTRESLVGRRRAWLITSGVLVAGAALAPLAALVPLAAKAQAPATGRIDFWRPGDPGTRLLLEVRAVSTAGEPLPGATLSLRQADGSGSYRADGYRGTVVADERGVFRISTAVPGSYGPPRHIHFELSAPGHRGIWSRILFRGDPQLGRSDDPHAIALEEVPTDAGTVMMGGAVLQLPPTAE